MVFPICTLTKMMFLCRYGRVTGQLERERSGDTTDRDPGGSGHPPCIGQIWGSQVFGEPVDERGEPLLARIISYWDPDQEIFVVQGHRIELTVQDVYFLTGLQPLGMVGNTQPVLPRGRHIMEFVERHYRLGLQVKASRIPIEDLERLETRAMAVAVLRILGNQAFHHITGG